MATLGGGGHFLACGPAGGTGHVFTRPVPGLLCPSLLACSELSSFLCHKPMMPMATMFCLCTGLKEQGQQTLPSVAELSETTSQRAFSSKFLSLGHSGEKFTPQDGWTLHLSPSTQTNTQNGPCCC